MFAAIKEAAARADLKFVVGALLAYAVSVPLVALRWRTMLHGVTGTRAPLGTLVLATLASSFVNNITPAARLSGEACRVIALVRLRLATMSNATAAAVLERLTEVPAVVAIAIMTLVVVGRLSLGAVVSLPTLTLALGVAFAVGAIVVATRRDAVARALSGLRQRWTRVSSVSVAPSALAASALMSVAIWALDVLRLRLAAGAFTDAIGLPEAATLSAITIVAGWVPTIGGLGAIEGGLIAGLVGFRVSPTDAVAITAVERAMSYGLSTTAGFISLSFLGGRSLWNAIRVGAPVAEGAAT